MCGITGVISSNKSFRDKITNVNNSLRHRGPDNEGFYHDMNISLGQRRLSINDLANGNQPISNEKNNLQLICNGEIYNSPELRKELLAKGHRFKTNSDVEVILHLYEEYGKESVKYLRGMFAFALWDTENKSLFLGRDHLGQKPLYFYSQDNLFIFASEAKAILASGLVTPEIDSNGLYHYISLRFIPDKNSLFKNIQKLPMASWLFYKNGQTEIQKYWVLKFNNKLQGSEKDIEENLDYLLHETIRLHLLSDVPIGTFLSGGVDSSIVTAIMADITKEKFPTFSIGVKENDFNEIPFAELVNNRYGLDGKNKIVEANLIELIPEMVYHMDEPSDPFGVGLYFASQLAGNYVKVVLGGDGGDENFAGYDRYAGTRIVNYYSIMPVQLRKILFEQVFSRVQESYKYKSLAQKLSWLHEMSKYENGERYAQSLSFLRFTHEAKQQLFTKEWLDKVEEPNSFSKILTHFNSLDTEDILDKMLYTDLMTRIPDHLMTLNDRMSMANSIETRSPLIDYKLVEFAASIPANLKLKRNNLKYILKKIALRYLPKDLVYREKQGFGFPIAKWMRTDLRNFILNLFKNSRLVEIGLFRKNYIEILISEHLSGKRDHNYKLWILINLEIWYKIFFDNYSVEETREFIKSLL